MAVRLPAQTGPGAGATAVVDGGVEGGLVPAGIGDGIVVVEGGGGGGAMAVSVAHNC